MSDEESVQSTDRCDECGRRASRSFLVPDRFLMIHGPDCSLNSINHPCDRCGCIHADLDFGQMLACTMDVDLDEGRAMQKRIVDRIERTWGGDR